MRWQAGVAELRFEVIREEEEASGEVRNKCGLMLKELTLLGWQWDAGKKAIVKTQGHFNRMPPVLVYAALKDASKLTTGGQVRAYMTHLRQCYVASIPLVSLSPGDAMAYIAFDTGDETKQSRRLQRPIQVSSGQLQLQQVADTGEMSERTAKSQSLSVAGQTIKHNLLRASHTLSQIREVGSTKFPSQESQLSFKPMSPNAPPLPPDLQTLVRARPLN